MVAPANIKKVLSAALLATLLGSSTGHAEVPIRADVIADPTPGRFSVCYNNTCKELAVIGLSPPQWQSVKALFQPPPSDAAGERKIIALAVARMEQLVGPLTDTAHDKGQNADPDDGSNEMDCIDESTNTTTYLRLFVHDGLLRWHTVEDRATRGWFLFGWPHTTAVIRERASGVSYAVDSWFLDNGQPPFILPLDEWRRGWHPPPPEKEAPAH
ncbi:MAG: hypothetical protein K8F27_15490 [Sulfuricellaceae bacterium]|nr:hypothetical protein [Sulfuricellaceae bacterium]